MGKEMKVLLSHWMQGGSGFHNPLCHRFNSCIFVHRSPMENEKDIREEIRREFQLERMILFSDAVFAIVITLMAIELRLPHKGEPLTRDELVSALIHLIPVALAYMGAFFYVGSVWYHHLRLFGLLKRYDRGLVIRNLTLLFFVGFFPFSASLVASVNTSIMLPIAVYFIIVLLCSFAHLRLQKYVLNKPELRLQEDVSEEINRYKVSRIVFILLCCMFVLISLTTYLIPDPRLKNFAWWWFFIFPFILKAYKKRMKLV